MKNFGRNFLLLSFALFASAQVPNGCSAPPQYPNIRLNQRFAALHKFSSGEKVYYDCTDDYSGRGSRAAQCTDGRWSQLTLKCEKKSCGSAGELPNGDFQYEGNAILGDRVYAICNQGYTLKGFNYMTCKRSGWSGDFPSCVAGEATCSAPAVPNSVNSTGAVSVFRVGDHVTFTCNRGFHMDGAQQIACGPAGQWQPRPPRCLNSPDKERGCGAPVTAPNSNANLVDKYIATTSFTSGARVQYKCAVGYDHSGGSRYRRCVEGTWTPLLLKCRRKLCGSAGEIMNGLFTYTGVEFGDTATAVCDEGHLLVGRATRNCMSRGWDGRVPACEAAVCAELPAATNAEMKAFQEPPYMYRAVLSYHCRVGTLIGPKSIWCTADGTWNHPAPKCQEITCQAPKVANAYWMRHQSTYKNRDTISIECDWGFTKSGPSTITCGADGRWSPGLPKCTPRRNQWRRY
ncbi:complement receptor type 1-like isoform X2 [Clinocottus analis]|uniref:complement receptor type 1-like isoform X2 n=1 Tax=Clinocottus analis TaxID=304258 RepID=UPI0035C09906